MVSELNKRKMFGFLSRNSVRKLQNKYDKLQKEAYDLSKSNSTESALKQAQANEVLRQIAQTKL